jgi:phenylpropionate dioxygenase-like ring-hydroxylating dioxygenase large terminal subunit
LAQPTRGDTEFLLPPSAYTDPAWLERERALVLHRSWALVADAATIPEVGDQVAVTIDRVPLVVVRTAGGLRAFHNTCRHRGMTIVQGVQCGGSLRCPYHGWEWDLEGDLVRVPQRRTQFPDLNPGAYGLHPAAVAEWEGMVFANPEPDAPDFATAGLAGLDRHLGSFRPGSLPQVANVTIPVACNWKLFVENHIDVYHLWYLHSLTLGDFDHARFEHHELGDSGNWASYEPMRSGRTGPPDGIRHLDERDRDGIQAHMLFPNVLMAASTNYFVTYAITPVTPEHSTIDLRVRTEPDADVDAIVAEVRSFIDEDVGACEAVQDAVRAGRFAVGPLARTHEAPITAFQTTLLRTMTADADPGSRTSVLAPARG